MLVLITVPRRPLSHHIDYLYKCQKIRNIAQSHVLQIIIDFLSLDLFIIIIVMRRAIWGVSASLTYVLDFTLMLVPLMPFCYRSASVEQPPATHKSQFQTICWHPPLPQYNTSKHIEREWEASHVARNEWYYDNAVCVCACLWSNGVFVVAASEKCIWMCRRRGMVIVSHIPGRKTQKATIMHAKRSRIYWAREIFTHTRTHTHSSYSRNITT